MITIEDFQKLEIKIGTIKIAERIPGADKLLRLVVDLGDQERQILAGIAESFTEPEVLVDKQVPVIANLEPRIIRGFESQGMILATRGDGGVVLIHPEKKVSAGVCIN